MTGENGDEANKQKGTRPPNSLIVSLSKNSSFYANIGNKLLNGANDHLSYDEIFVTGLGTAIKVAIETAMLLSNRKVGMLSSFIYLIYFFVGVIKKIETSYYNSDTVKKHIPKINIIVAKS
ncbi:uncharacterized protein TA03185 [Theileria annulata]|uniref:DNA/RNA-binding protein Alba-like domain-containing protein n=1 Tax=Theileria annulata TaxID=5874 RepID=Q4UCZ5_THEAN|nr:uncharacterized protein TA03185 [Theileria annulata]CAI75306.1 hypothetical protein TA03185 [Theileria annulata]|eukprot:XP_954782.1 hypothetical protein TA03185 [Theileria annulata]